MHASGQRDLRWLAARTEALMELSNRGIETNRGHSRHVENAADAGAPPPKNAASPSEASTVASQWRDAHQGGDLFMAQTTQLRQL